MVAVQAHELYLLSPAHGCRLTKETNAPVLVFLIQAIKIIRLQYHECPVSSLLADCFDVGGLRYFYQYQCDPFLSLSVDRG
jgi:hypothetical protein